MAKIIVVGAGHGGLVAAAKLAKKGFEVTVIEKNKRENLGHDWEDRFTFELLLRLTENDTLPAGSWRYRGNCVFVSPSKNTRVEVTFDEEHRHRLMWRKPLADMLISYAEASGVKFIYSTDVVAPIIADGGVRGVKLRNRDEYADMVIDAAGFFSPVRTSLPDEFKIEKEGVRGDAFYGFRAYFDRSDKVGEVPEFQHEVYLYHECEQGLSWFCTYEDYVDVLIGRIDPLTPAKVEEQLSIFRSTHPVLGDNMLHGGYGIIPVRRPLALMVADGYAAVGDSAFMTTPMNGMGIDLSMLAGELLADTIAESATRGENPFSKESLWRYNRDYHRLYGSETAKNEGLKNALLRLPPEGVDFLFDNAVIQSSDLAGAGKNMNFKILMGKFVRGMRSPAYFFALLNGLIKGGKVAKLLGKAPENYDISAIERWQNKIKAAALTIE